MGQKLLARESYVSVELNLNRTHPNVEPSSHIEAG